MVVLPLHPNFGITKIANFWSRKADKYTGHHDANLGMKRNICSIYNRKLKNKSFRFFIFGHRHLPIDKQIGDSHYINLGDWLSYFTYAEWDGSKLSLRKFENIRIFYHEKI